MRSNEGRLPPCFADRPRAGDRQTMESEIDAIFYRLIHQLASTAPTGENSERRTQKRRPFPTWQRIAPYDGHSCPDQSQFFEVQCHDLTQNGFSFLVIRRPVFTSLVVEFGAAPDLIYVAAQILHFARVLVYPNGVVEHLHRHGNEHGEARRESSVAGERPTHKILVGCRFTRRVPRPLWADLVKK